MRSFLKPVVAKHESNEDCGRQDCSQHAQEQTAQRLHTVQCKFVCLIILCNNQCISLINILAQLG